MGTGPEVVRTLVGALAAGMLAQLAAERLRIPSILLLLPAGILLGPSGLGLLEPDRLGSALEALVSIGVAIILFEGSLTLRLADVRQWRGPIGRLASVGLLTTATLAAGLAVSLGGLEPAHAALFGALVSVTGPTVIRPLLRRVPVSHGAATTLEGEGILADVAGVVLAVAVLEVVLGHGLLGGLLQFAVRVALGTGVGLAGAALLRAIVRRSGLVPDDLVAPCGLAGVLGLYAAAERMLPESGLVAVVAAGLVLESEVGARGEAFRALKETLTVLFLSLIFVLLGAHVPLTTVAGAGWGGVATVAGLVLVVRPACVAVSTLRTRLTLRERFFLMGVAPRGVVAASVASLFALRLERQGLPGGDRVVALVFLTVIATVAVYGLGAAPLARALGVRRDPEKTLLLVGANALGRRIGRLFADAGWRVTLLDRNERRCALAAEAGLRAVAGSALDPDDLERAGAGASGCVLALTENPEVNALACRLARQHFRVAAAHPAVLPGSMDAARLTAGPEAAVLFGGPVPLDEWNARARVGGLRVEEGSREPPAILALPVGIRRGERLHPYHAGSGAKPGERVLWLVADPDRGDVPRGRGVGDTRALPRGVAP
ncbi:MAG: cation:proton antiporter [Planctomycetales bacterium]|nr:cation:proton antiporter [Planctomycetales bacterium]